MTPTQADCLWAVAYHSELARLLGNWTLSVEDKRPHDSARWHADRVLAFARKHDPSEARERELMLLPASPKDDCPDRK